MPPTINKPKNKSRGSSRFRKSALLLAAVFVLIFFIILPIAQIKAQTTSQPQNLQQYLANQTFDAIKVQIPNSSGGYTDETRYLSQISNINNATGKQYAVDSNSNFYVRDGSSAYRPLTDVEKQNFNPDSIIQKSTQASVAYDTKIKNPGSDPLGIYSALLRAFAWICDTILWLFSWLVALGGFLLDIAFNIGTTLGFTNSQIVQIGWPIIRDLANMFFSLILLVISFATILRIESYGMKQILWRLVVAALLINFSLVIAGVVIDASNVMTRFFIKDNFQLNNKEATISSAILNSLQTTNFWKSDLAQGNQLQGSQLQGAATPGSPNFGGLLLNTILGIILMAVTAFVLMAAAFLFFIRMVVLWILLIFAPLAWLAMILPGTRSMWNKWWSEFIKWNIFPVVYGFFIYLTVAMISKGVLLNNPKILEATSQANATWTGQAGSIIQNGFYSSLSIITNYVIMIIFLVAGLIFARSSGITGASAMANLGASASKGASGFLGRWADRSLAKGAESESRFRQGLSYLSPTAWKQGFAKRRAQQEREAFEVAGGARQDSLNRFWGGPKKWGKKGSDMHEFTDRAKRARRATERREINSNNAEELVAGFEKAKQEKNYGKMGAYSQALAEQNDFNELFRHYAATGGATEQGEGKNEMSAEGLEDFVNRKLIGESGMDKQDALRLGYDLMRMHENNGQWLGRIIKYDGKTGQYAFEDDEKDSSGNVIQSKYDVARNNATIEWSKQDPQAQARTTGRFSLIKERYGAGGVTIDGGITNAGRKMISTIGGEHANRVQRHTRNVMMLNHADEVEQLNPDLYSRSIALYQAATAAMTTNQQYNDYVDAQQTYIGIHANTYDPNDKTKWKKGEPTWGRAPGQQGQQQAQRPPQPPPPRRHVGP
jgi:hypothetical protein